MTATHNRSNFLQPTTTHRIFLNCGQQVPHMFKWNSPKDAFCQVWLKLAKWFGEDENVESLQTDGLTDKWKKTGNQKSSLKVSAEGI